MSEPQQTERLARWRSARRVLLVRLDNLGDVLMTTPAMRAVRQALPDAQLTLLTSPSGMSAASHLSMIDDTMGYNAPWVKSSEADNPGGFDDLRLLRRLSQRHFDAAIVFTVATQSALPAALICRQAGIGLRLAHSRENPYELLSDWVRDTDAVGPGMRHEVQRQVDLLGSVGLGDGTAGPLEFNIHHEDRESVLRRLLLAGVDPSRPYVVLHPGATAPSRRYPARGFGEAASLLAWGGMQCVFAGGIKEAPLIQEARAEMQVGGMWSAVIENQSLGELAALIAGAQVLVANNSAPAHLAAAVGTPVVDLYALTNPQHTPWRVSSQVLFHDVPCRNCLRSVCPMGHHDCLRKVTPGAVAEAALDLIALSHPSEAVSGADPDVLPPPPTKHSTLEEAALR